MAGAHHGHHPAAGNATQLQQRAADPPRGRMNQDIHAGPQHQVVKKSMIGGEKNRWKGRPLVGGKLRAGGDGIHLTGGHTKMGRIGPKARHPENGRPRGQAIHVPAAVEQFS